jgi:hypothetical protein
VQSAEPLLGAEGEGRGHSPPAAAGKSKWHLVAQATESEMDGAGDVYW